MHSYLPNSCCPNMLYLFNTQPFRNYIFFIRLINFYKLALRSWILFIHKNIILQTFSLALFHVLHFNPKHYFLLILVIFLLREIKMLISSLGLSIWSVAITSCCILENEYQSTVNTNVDIIVLRKYSLTVGSTILIYLLYSLVRVSRNSIQFFTYQKIILNIYKCMVNSLLHFPKNVDVPSLILLRNWRFERNWQRKREK